MPPLYRDLRARVEDVHLAKKAVEESPLCDLATFRRGCGGFDAAEWRERSSEPDVAAFEFVDHAKASWEV